MTIFCSSCKADSHPRCSKWVYLFLSVFSKFHEEKQPWIPSQEKLDSVSSRFSDQLLTISILINTCECCRPLCSQVLNWPVWFCLLQRGVWPGRRGCFWSSGDTRARTCVHACMCIYTTQLCPEASLASFLICKVSMLGDPQCPIAPVLEEEVVRMPSSIAHPPTPERWADVVSLPVSCLSLSTQTWLKAQ